MQRSLIIRQNCIKTVRSALPRNSYRNQRDLAEDVGVCLDTISKFFNCKPIDRWNFIEICDKLGLDWLKIADFNSNDTGITETPPPPDDFIYVERPPIESICCRTLSQPGALLRIKAPGLRGKTWLMVKLLRQLAEKPYRIVPLNLNSAEEEHFSNLDIFLKWFCVSVGQNLGMSNKIADYWDEKNSTSKVDCETYFQNYLLPEADSPLVLWLDGVERIFPHQKVAADFLGILRVWHEKAKIYRIWQRLRLVVAHSTEVFVTLNINESPFNVGEPVELPDFTPVQVENLAQQHGIDWNLAQVQQLMDIVGGHPYLVQQALSKINRGMVLEQILQTAATEAGIYGNHLRKYWNTIHEHPQLAEELRRVVEATTSVRLEPMQAYKLQSMGLVHLTGNEVEIACNLYRRYFCDRFGV